MKPDLQICRQRHEKWRPRMRAPFYCEQKCIQSGCGAVLNGENGRLVVRSTVCLRDLFIVETCPDKVINGN